VGLLFGVIPGVIAFAVDFSTGCIYLPPEGGYGLGPQGAAPASPTAPAGWQLAATVPPFAEDEVIAAALVDHLQAGDLAGEGRTVAIRWHGEAALPGLGAPAHR
jgi:hypothetical protein